MARFPEGGINGVDWHGALPQFKLLGAGRRPLSARPKAVRALPQKAVVEARAQWRIHGGRGAAAPERVIFLYIYYRKNVISSLIFDICSKSLLISPPRGAHLGSANGHSNLV